MPVPLLAQMLVTAINEHEAALARVSKLLHDDVSQVLSAVGLQLDAMRMEFSNQAPDIDRRATEIQALLEQAIEQLRDVSNELNPSIVERAGLQFTLALRSAHARTNRRRENFLQDRGVRCSERSGPAGVFADRHPSQALAW